MEVGHRLEALLAAQERVDGVALDRAGPDDRDLDHEVVEALRPRLGERLHLGPALDLEDADRVGRLEHREDLRDVLGQPVEVEADRAVVLDELERLVHRGEHPEPEQVELDELERLDVALVELDDDPVDHRRPLDRRDVDERRRGHQHPARVDRQVAREAVDPGAELEPALPVGEADRRAAAGLRRRLRLDPGDRGVGRRGALVGAARRRRVPAGRPPELVGGAARVRRAALVRGPRRRLELAALRVDPPAVDERRRDQPVRDRPGSRSRGRPAARRRWPGCRPDRPRRRAGRPAGSTAATRARPPTSPERGRRSPVGRPRSVTSRASRSQANGRGAFGSSGFGGWRQGGTFPTSGIRVFSWPIPSTKPSASAAWAAPVRSDPRPAAPRPAVGRTRRTRRRPRGRAGP